MIIDAILLISILVGLHFIRLKYPNFLFFPKGAAMFLPPPQSTLQPKPKKKNEKVEQQVQVMKIQYDHVKEYPFSNQFSRVQTTTVGLAIFFFLRVLINFMYQNQTLFPFYTTVLILVYTLKLGIDTFFMTNYNRKNSFIIALSINIVFYIFFIALDNIQGIFDKQLKIATLNYIKHLQIIFNRQVTFFTHKAIMIIIFIVNFFIIIAMIPNIIKFGNWYVKTLKQTSYQQTDDTISNIRRQGAQQRDIKDQQKQLKQESKNIIFKLNVYLVSILVLLFFSHRFANTLLAQPVVFLLRVVSLGVCVHIICSTMSHSIEFNGSFAYKHILEYYKSQDIQKRKEYRTKISTYVYYIWYHYFQFAIRIIIPILLFLLIVNWKYLNIDKNFVNTSITNRQVNLDIECKIYTNQIQILQNLYKCSMIQQSKLQQKFFLNGIIQTISKTLQSKQVQKNMQNYGLITGQIMIQLYQHIFWYSTLSIYLMTVIYIFFLRKTVFDI